MLLELRHKIRIHIDKDGNNIEHEITLKRYEKDTLWKIYI